MHVPRNLLAALRRARDRLRDLLRHRLLLFERCGDGRAEAVHFADAGPDRTDRRDGARGGILDVGHLLRNLVRRVGRLHRELLDLGGDDRKSATSLAGPRRLDRGIERQEVGLLRDGADEHHDLPHPLGRGGEASDIRVRLVGEFGRDSTAALVCCIWLAMFWIEMTSSSAAAATVWTLADASVEALFAFAACSDASPATRVRTCAVLDMACVPWPHGFEHVGHRTAEAADERFELLALQTFSLARLCGLLLQPQALHRIGLENFERARHPADLVPAPGAGTR